MEMNIYNVNQLFGTLEGQKDPPKDFNLISSIAVHLARRKLVKALMDIAERFEISRLECPFYVDAESMALTIVDLRCATFPNDLQQILEFHINEQRAGLVTDGPYKGSLTIRMSYKDTKIFKVEK